MIHDAQSIGGSKDFFEVNLLENYRFFVIDHLRFTTSTDSLDDESQ